MESLYEAMSRKIRVRKQAVKTLRQRPADKERIVGSGNFWQVERAARAANVYARQDGYWEIYSCRRIIGPLIVFGKRVLRKLLKILFGWYIFPIYQKQTSFNLQVLDCINSIEACLKDLNDRSAMDRQVQLLNRSLQALKSDFEESREETGNSLLHLYHMARVPEDYTLVYHDEFDYLNFENSFRGSSQDVINSQLGFLPYFLEKGEPVLDIGCGRGEFLKYLEQHHVNAYGIDCQAQMIDQCTKNGLKVRCENALTHLRALDDSSLGGVFMAHVIEHWPVAYILAVIRQIYRVLKPGCYFIFTTPNPSCLYTLTEFYNDAQHIKPIHFKEAQYYCELAGFSEPEIHFVESTRSIHALNIPESAFQMGFVEKEWEDLNKYLYGYREYTIVVKK